MRKLNSSFRILNLGFFAFANSLLGVSASANLSSSFYIEGKLLSADRSETITAVVDFLIGVYSPDGLCLLYQEQASGIDLAESDGTYRILVGSNSRTPQDPGLSFTQIFSNGNTPLRSAGANCPTGYTPTAGEMRNVRLQVTRHDTGTTETLSPDLAISPIPQATVAETIQGLSPTDLLQITGNSTPYVLPKSALDLLLGPDGPAATPVSDASSLHHHDSLYARLSGSSTMTLQSGALFGLGSRTSDPTGLGSSDAGKTWYDTSSNQIKFWDGGAVRSLGTSGASVTSVTSAGSPITIGGTSTTPTVGITQATSVSSGYLSSADWLTFSGKFGSNSTLNGGQLWVGNASNNPAAVALGGDATLSNTGALTVTKLQGTAVSSTAPTSNQVLQYNGTAWAPTTLSGTQGPNSFGFTDQSGINLNVDVVSNTITLNGFTGLLPAACTGCIGIIRNGILNGNTAAFLPGDTLALKVASSPNPNTSVTATVTVGSTTSSTWTITTSANSPNPFAFTDQTEVNTNATITSNAVTLGGTFTNLTATCGTGCTAIARNGIWGGSPVSGFNSGDTIQIRQTSSASSTSASTSTVTVGGTTSSVWSVTTTTDACAATSPTVGTVCADGTIYAGNTPDGNVKMFTTPCDEGMTGTQGSCASTPLSRTWNNGVAGGYYTGFSSFQTGEANTIGLVAATDIGATYMAALHCNSKTTGGHSDWYLPAEAELNILYFNRASIGGFDASGAFYWSSSENPGRPQSAYSQRFSDGFQGNGYDGGPGKTGTAYLRCVRK